MPRSILYVSQTSRIDRPYFDPSVRYRCYNVAAQARKRGIKAWVMSQAEFEEAEPPTFDVYVFHRPKLTRLFLDRLRGLPAGAARIADYDDLTFDVAAAPQTSAVRNRGEAVWAVRKALSSNQAALRLFSRFSVSTVPLKEAVERLAPGAEIFVLPNRPDDGYLAMAAAARKRRGRPRQMIGYFAGTASHDEDLSSIWAPLATFCRANGVALTLAGPVRSPGKAKGSGFDIIQANLVSFHQLSHTMADCDFVIAPLIYNAFSACKSGIKLMEAGAAGTPLVATPIPDIDRFETPLLFRAREPSDWTAALEGAWARDRRADAEQGRALAASLDDRAVLGEYFERLLGGAR